MFPRLMRLYFRLWPRVWSGVIIEEMAIIAEKYSRHEYFLLQMHKYVKRYPSGRY